MDCISYLRQRKKIIESISTKLSIWEDKVIMEKFNLVSASLLNYLPHLKFDQHEEIFKEILLNQNLSILEQSYSSVIENTTLENFNDDFFHSLNQAAGIICTFHTGSYRIINHYLLKNKVTFSLVAAKSVLESQAKELERLHELLYLKDSPMFNIIDAEEPNSMFQMIKAIKRGEKLVFYIDGNTGVQLKDEKDNTFCSIRFLNQGLYARKGIGYLSYITKTPIFIFSCYRKSIDDIRLAYLDKIVPSPTEDRELFVLNSTQSIYNSLASIVNIYPGQWEGWLYLQQSINLINKVEHPKPNKQEKQLTSSQFKFNKDYFGVFNLNTGFYLFKKSEFSFFLIDSDIYEFLYKAILTGVSKNEISEDVFLDLYNNRVLIEG